MKTNRQRLHELICSYIRKGDFTLNSGAKSPFYFDVKALTLNGEALTLAAKLLNEQFRDIDCVAVGGLTLGADFITSAILVDSYLNNGNIKYGSIARKHQKDHGTKQQIENVLPPHTKIIVVDDVISTGKSILEACQHFEKAEYDIVGVGGIVDRQMGGVELLQQKYQRVITLFSYDEFQEMLT